MSDDTTRPNPLIDAMRRDPLGRAKQELEALRNNWAQHNISNFPAPLITKDPSKPGREWLPERSWISGGDAFEILRLQCQPYDDARAIARICQIISDQWDREQAELNYVIASIPPSHVLLNDFDEGTYQWFRALYSFLTLLGASQIEGWEELVSSVHEWLSYDDNLRIRTHCVLESALTLDWQYHELSLPEAKQEPIWSFVRAMTWIATRDYLALARVGDFRRAAGTDEPVATDGVSNYNTQALGWLHTKIAYCHCKCGALQEFGLHSIKHCTCISIAWEELVRFRGGLTPDTPELVFGLQEGWLSMTWPDGADNIRFLRSDILDHWPTIIPDEPASRQIDHSTAAGEHECREWLVAEFNADVDKRRSKKDFRDAALAKFQGRLSERGFNLRVWPKLAQEHGRDGAGAKRKS